MDTRKNSRIDYHLNSKNFGRPTIPPMIGSIGNNNQLSNDTPIAIEFPYIAINQNSDNLVVCI